METLTQISLASVLWDIENCSESDQTPKNVVSDLVLPCLFTDDVLFKLELLHNDT